MYRFVLNVCVGLLLTVISVIETSGAELKLAHVFQDKMVLQREMKVPIWGWADAGTKVTVNFAGQTKTAVAGKDGYWLVNLDPLKASAKGQELTVSCDGKKLTLKDVLVGEVWLCAGQSNMAWLLEKKLLYYPQLKKRLGKTDFPLIRFIRYPAYVNAKPQKDMNSRVHGSSKWKAFSASTVESSQTMPFFFARKLYQELKIPIGLIEIAEGATPQTAWCSREVIDRVAAETDSKATYEYFYQKAAKRVAKRKSFKTWEDYEKFDAAFQKRKKGRYTHAGMKVFPCVLYNGLVHPLAPFAFRGAIWHQGEGGPYQEHAERMKAMVTSWRKLFGQDFYFFWGSLSRDTKVPPPIAPMVKMCYRAQRNLQFLDAQVLFGYNSKAKFCDFYDLGNFNTHFGEKDKAGERYAKAALTSAYKKPNIFTGPQLINTKKKKGEMQLQFAHAGSGLVYKPSIDGISGFVLESGKDWLWIEPTIIEKDKLVFKHDKITEKSNLFYGYHFNPHETLFNKEGIPASIFPREIHTGGHRKNDVFELVKFIKPPKKNELLNITHVRRNAYVFSVDSWPRENKGVNRVQVYVPKEWGDVAAQHAGKELKVGKITTDPQGQRTIEVDVKTNAGPYVIYNKTKGAEALAEADCSRF